MALRIRSRGDVLVAWAWAKVATVGVGVGVERLSPLWPSHFLHALLRVPCSVYIHAALCSRWQCRLGTEEDGLRRLADALLVTN